MAITSYHAKYFAHELTKRCSADSIEKLAGALVDAQVDLNPHQVEAALFAFNSPLSKGALLADEVGLGKTIEAGLVLSQKWAERKRRVLIITPANLRKQWHQELHEKFFLPCQILESKSYNQAIRRGHFRPLEIDNSIVICSYQFARSKASDVSAVRWDLVVIDEAHRLRNVYKTSNVIANTLKMALKDVPKLLLTATPLQNSLLELFGLVSIIDEHAFGDLKSFREQFSHLNDQSVFDTLKARLKPICHRTLRRQVTAYVPYTRRHPMVEEFKPDESEDRLYTLVSDYLRRDNLQALPASQRSLMTLVLRKLLASSTFAIAGALDTLIGRLKTKIAAQPPLQSLEEELDQDYEALDETAEEWDADSTDEEPLSPKDRAALEREITDLEEFRDLAVSITRNAKGDALLAALDRAFAEADRLGAVRKAIIFTESRRTQEYLQRVLADKGETDVNDSILHTLKNEPAYFFYLNNGLTAYCDKFSVENEDRANATRKRITARVFSIVNGAQTLGSIQASCPSGPNAAPDGYAFLKIISLERCEDDVEFAKRITRSTNFQNRIQPRDFAALDDQHERIASQLALDKVFYHYKSGADVPDSDDRNFSISDAAIALACAQQDKECNLISLLVADHGALWSEDKIYKREEDTKPTLSRCEFLFSGSTSARTVWRAVQARQIVMDNMIAAAKAESGVRADFFRHGRWLVLNLVFLRLHPHQGEELFLSKAVVASIISECIEIAENLWIVAIETGLVSRSSAVGGMEVYEAPQQFEEVFGDSAECKRLRAATLKKMNEKPAKSNEAGATEGTSI